MFKIQFKPSSGMYFSNMLFAACYVSLAIAIQADASETQQDGTSKQTKPAPKMNQMEANFAKRMSGAVLSGFNTDSNKQPDDLTEEQYSLLDVEKLDGDLWQFRTRIRYGDRDVTLPISLPVRWAGDTPVIIVDNVGIPGMGTFSARVLIHDDHYAGYWQGSDHGGHLFGYIKRPSE